MKIALIAHGGMPIPPKSFGAVENILWLMQTELTGRGHRVDIYNSRFIEEVIFKINREGYDFVHCHNEQFALACHAHLKRPYAITSHHGGWHRFASQGQRESPLGYLFEDTLRASANIVLSEEIKSLYLRNGYSKFIRVLRNPVEVDSFRFAPTGSGKAICLGAIQKRKRQEWLCEALSPDIPLDFVGPRQGHSMDAAQDFGRGRYLGVWDKSEIYENLTNYNCLVLLSESEAAPKVVLEAMAAGLSLVITEACAANLDPHPFITLLSENNLQPEIVNLAIFEAIRNNQGFRKPARLYARERFDIPVVMTEYEQIINDFLAHDRIPR